MTSGGSASRGGLQEKRSVNTMQNTNSKKAATPPPTSAAAKRVVPRTSDSSKTAPSRPSIAAPPRRSSAPKSLGIVTPSNKYAHVPSRVFSGIHGTQPPSRGSTVPATSTTTPAPPPPQSAPAQSSMSHEEFFGHPLKSNEHVATVLQRSRFMSPQKISRDSSQPIVAEQETDPAPPPRTSAPTTPVQRRPSASSSFKDLVMDDAEDLPARRSASAPRSQRPSGSSLPRPRPQLSSEAAHRPSCSWVRPPTENSTTIVSSQQSPRSSVVLPESVDEDIVPNRRSRWSVHEHFASPPDVAPMQEGAAVGGDTTTDCLHTGTNESQWEPSRTDSSGHQSRLSEVLSRHSHASSSAFTAVSPLTETSRPSERDPRGESTQSDAMRMSDAMRKTFEARPSVPQLEAPPNTPVDRQSRGSGRLSTEAGGTSDIFDSPRRRPRASSGPMPHAPHSSPVDASAIFTPTRGSSQSRPSVILPNAPPTTPIDGPRNEGRLSSSWADLLWPRSSGSGSLAVVAPSGGLENSSAAESPFKSMMTEEKEDSMALGDIASPPPSIPPRASRSLEDPLPRGSTGGGLFARIRNSINLTLAKPTEKHRDVSLTPSGRRKSVAFCSPERLEVRVDQFTPRGSVKHHNEDVASPAPILVRTPQHRHPAIQEEDDVVRSDSPSRANAALSASVDATTQAAAEVVDEATTSLGGSLPLPASARPHTVDRLGRVCRSKTPGPSGSPNERDYEASIEREQSSPLDVPSLGRSPIPSLVATEACSPPPIDPNPVAFDDTTTDDAVRIKVETVLRSHTVASALRILTVTEIATFLSTHDVAYNPEDRKVKLLDTARKLVLSVPRSCELTSPGAISLPRPTKRPRDADDGEGPDTIPTSSWTVQQIRQYAQDNRVSLQGIPQRKAELLRHLSNSMGRSPSADLLGL